MPSLKHRRCQWPGNVIALSFVALPTHHRIKDIACFDSFRHNAIVKLVRQSDDALHEDTRVRRFQDTPYEALIDLEYRGRVKLKLRQVAITRAEIVNRDRATHAGNFMKILNH